jgi:endoribonuclease Dicer
MQKFRTGECLCLVATSVACEGVDIPQCNLMIRYKFRVDEISSYQMRGKIKYMYQIVRNKKQTHFYLKYVYLKTKSKIG